MQASPNPRQALDPTFIKCDGATDGRSCGRVLYRPSPRVGADGRVWCGAGGVRPERITASLHIDLHEAGMTATSAGIMDCAYARSRRSQGLGRICRCC